MIGRKKEIKMLRNAAESKCSEFVAVYGRRRVGKTFLVRETFNSNFTFQHSGVANSGTKIQLERFRRSLIESGHVRCPALKTWFQAFDELKTVVVSSNMGKKVLFIDEMPWMDKPNANFIPALENFWNAWASARKDVLLIVCGSATSWMLNKVIHGRGGLHNRVTVRIPLRPFCLAECEELAASMGLEATRYQLVQYYMALGGVPYYWNYLQCGLSVAQNMDAMFFAGEDRLEGEFAELFASLLDTKAVGRLTPEVLEWTARTMMDAQDWKAARAAASVLERRQVDPAWTQTAATLLGQAHERLGESDAAKEAYARALATGSETECGAQAALALGRLESAGGQFDEAREHLENAVTRAQSQDQLPLRIQAYAALAANEEERGEMDKALGYHMLVGSLFNEERQVAHALSRAAAILREKGREKEAADVMADLRKRFPNAPEAQ